MTTVQPNVQSRRFRPTRARRSRPRRLEPLRATVLPTDSAPDEATTVGRVRFTFQNGHPMSPAQVAVLRVAAAAGIRLPFVVSGLAEPAEIASCNADGAQDPSFADPGE